MVWNVEITQTARKQLNKFDWQISQMIVTFINEKLSTLTDPRSIGESLKGSELGKFWKYRLGDYS